MNARIDVLADDWGRLHAHLLQNGLEQGAFLLAEPVSGDGLTRLLVHEVIPVPQEHLLAQSGAYLETDPIFFAPILKRARAQHYSVIVAHSHPFSGDGVAFSHIDDRGEADLIPKIQSRISGLPHGALVLGQASAAARIYQPGRKATEAALRVIGNPVCDVHSHRSATTSSEGRYHRQILAWGAPLQHKISSLHVAIVGAGGTGSHIAQQLLHLGVGHITIVDPDVVDETNLNRLVGAHHTDPFDKTPKTRVIDRVASHLGRDGAIRQLVGSVLQREVALELTHVDVIFGCTDNLPSRRLLNRLSIQYFVPLIDVGMDLESDSQAHIRTAAGRVTIVLPSGPCLHRVGVLREDGEVSGGYVAGLDDPAPAVVSLNGVVASLAVTELLALIGGLRHHESYSQLTFAPMRGLLVRESVSGLCDLCSEVCGSGDSRALPWEDRDAAS